MLYLPLLGLTLKDGTRYGIHTRWPKIQPPFQVTEQIAILLESFGVNFQRADLDQMFYAPWPPTSRNQQKDRHVESEWKIVMIDLSIFFFGGRGTYLLVFYRFYSLLRKKWIWGWGWSKDQRSVLTPPRSAGDGLQWHRCGGRTRFLSVAKSVIGASRIPTHLKKNLSNKTKSQVCKDWIWLYACWKTSSRICRNMPKCWAGVEPTGTKSGTFPLEATANL